MTVFCWTLICVAGAGEFALLILFAASLALAAENRHLRVAIMATAPRMAMAPPACLGTRVDRYRCCLPALAGFST